MASTSAWWKNKTILGAVIGILAVTFAIYVPSLSAEFTNWDDPILCDGESLHYEPIGREYQNNVYRTDSLQLPSLDYAFLGGQLPNFRLKPLFLPCLESHFASLEYLFVFCVYLYIVGSKVDCSGYLCFFVWGASHARRVSSLDSRT